MAQIEHAWQGKVWFTSREQVLEYLKLLNDADILYYGNLIRSLAEKPCSNEEFRKVRDAHVVAMGERARELQRMEKDLGKRDEDIHRLTEQLKTKEEWRAFLANIGGEVLEKDKANQIEQVKCEAKLDIERKENEMKEMKSMNEKLNAQSDKRVAEKVEEISRLREEKVTEIIRLRKEKDDEVASVKKERQTEVTELRQLVESMNAKIENFAGTQKSSANLGKQGEDYLCNLLQGSGKFELVQDVSSGHRRGDLVVKLFSYPGKQIMVDCKNHKKAVPGEDKEKFLRDLDENASYVCGMIVSLKSAVQTNEPDFVLKRSEAGKPYLYISHLKSYPGAATLVYVACLSLLNNVEHHKDDTPFCKFISSHLLSLRRLLDTSKELKTKASKLEENAKEIVDDVEKILKDVEKIFEAMNAPSSSTGAKRSQTDNGEHCDEKRPRHVQQT
eukprot:Seg2489.3 transcript_id=Seg2489.3/GoldUCD/mRNA.D3Y31 product="hypothetical protein" protein_id=Seg2489.3/GoldUCD/D3Y31